MADIDVVKGRPSTWIWWVLAAVAIVLLLMFLLRRNDHAGPARSQSSSVAPAQPSLVLAA